jgi:hypothetical protein
MKNKQSTMNSANYGIDGPVVLRNLIIIGIAAAGLGVLAHYRHKELDLTGSYETSSNDDNEGAISWPLPNVVGISKRKPLSKR